MNLTDETLEALNVCEDYGVDVDTTGTGPVFGSVTAQYIGTNSNIASLMGVTKEAIKKDLRWYSVPSSIYNKINEQITNDVFTASSYEEALSRLLNWVGQDEDEDGYY